jgi:hypothetical protein
MIREFMEELWDELSDFFEDFWELLRTHKPSKPRKMKLTLIDGVAARVRPAYLLAERVDNTIKFVFGISICLSAITATFLGYTTLSDLLEMLIGSLIGRIVMLIVGGCYLIIAIWKLMRIQEK